MNIYDAEALSFYPGEGAAELRATEMVEDTYAKWSRGEHAHFAVTKLKTGVVVGMAGLGQLDTNTVNVGYAIGCDHRGNGYAHEAAVAVLEFAFAVLDLAEVSALTVTENYPSQVVLRKLGFCNTEPVVYRGRHGFRWVIRRNEFYAHTSEAI